MEVWESRCSGGTSERIGPFLKQKSAVVRFAARGLAEYRRGHAQPGNRALPPGALAETTGVYLDNMRSMLAILTSRDINSLIILQPARVWYEAHVTDLPAESIQAMSSMRDAIKQGIAQDLVRFGAHVRSIDMDDIGRMPQLFSDSMHFTESGNRTVATRIAKYMINENPGIGREHDTLF